MLFVESHKVMLETFQTLDFQTLDFDKYLIKPLNNFDISVTDSKSFSNSF
jgi:hypothetical protein